MSRSRVRLRRAPAAATAHRIAQALFGPSEPTALARALSPADVGRRAAPTAWARTSTPADAGPAPTNGPATEPQAEDALTDFQAEAARRATDILARRGGVLIADGVGLGKTYIAAALVEAKLRGGGRVWVVAPSALRRPWLDVLRRATRRAGAGAVADGRQTGRSRVGWVSHARLSRGRGPSALAGGRALVVVDEAHAFRNPRTRRYRSLARLCRDADVVLLTATPVNNALHDLYHQLRLFASDRTFADLGVPDLEAAFREAVAGDGPGGSALTTASSATGALHAVLRDVMIRRTRPLLRERGARLPGGRSFPERAPIVPLRYQLSDGGAPDVDALACLERIEFAFTAMHGRSGAAELLKIVLLKRLESSVAAFSASLRSLVRYHRALVTALDEGRLLSAAEHRALIGGADQLVLAPLVLRAAPRAMDIPALRKRVAQDAGRLGRLAGDMSGSRDTKLDVLRRQLRSLDGEKVLVFTEFRETALYLWRALRLSHRVGLVHGGGAALGAGAAGRRVVIERFAPASNGAKPPRRHERVDVLIATDVLSEGLNLQDAAHVISYDLPWNPVRLIQRVGRIDRLGSPHDTVYSYCFVPDAGLDRLLSLMDRLRAKLTAIRCAAGTGSGPAPPEADSPFLERLARGDADVLDEIERVDAAPWEAEERLRAILASCAADDLELEFDGSDPSSVPLSVFDAASVVDADSPARAVLVAIRVERDETAPPRVRLALVRPSGPVTLDEPAAFDLIRVALTKAPDTRAAPRQLVEVALRRARRAVLRAETGRGGSGRPVGRRASRWTGRAGAKESRAARDVARLLLGTVPAAAGADAGLCRRADACLARLAEGVNAGVQIALLDILEEHGPATGQGGVDRADQLVRAIETVLGPRRNLGPTAAPPRLWPLAILVAAP